LKKRFPKRGFRAGTFNIRKHITSINLGRIAYYIEKGDLDASKTITMQDLLKSGAVSKCNNGVKLLGKGSDKIK
jgi:ribosomal protein L15